MTAHAHIEAHSPRVGLSRVGGDCVSRPVHGARGRAFEHRPVIIGFSQSLAKSIDLQTLQTGRGFGSGAFPVTGPALLTSLTAGRRNRMDRCATRQTRAGHPVCIACGQSVLSIGGGGGADTVCLPISFPTGWFSLLRQPGRVSAILRLCAPRHNSKLGQHVRQDLIEPSHHHSKTSIATGIKRSSEAKAACALNPSIWSKKQ